MNEKRFYVVNFLWAAHSISLCCLSFKQIVDTLKVEFIGTARGPTESDVKGVQMATNKKKPTYNTELSKEKEGKITE